MLSGNRGGRQLFDVRGRSRESACHSVPFVMLAQGPDMEPPRVPGPLDGKASRNVGSRRIFPPMYKLQVLDSYRHDHDCKGNQRATARKYNIHRRQIQKWLQCETALRASVAEALRYDAGAGVGGPDSGATASRLESRLAEPASRVFKHDARTLKLVAQKLYPSSLPGTMPKDDWKGEVTKTAPGCFVPKEYQLNDTRREAMGTRPADPGAPRYKLNMDGTVRSLILKDSISGSESKLPVQKYCPHPEETHREPMGLPAPRALPLPRAPAAVFPSRPTPLFTSPLCSPYGEEPYNLVMSPASRATPPSTPRPASVGALAVNTVAASTSPLPARVAEIVADSKTSAFSPKRKWLNALQETSPPSPVLPPKQRIKQVPADEPMPKKPCPDFSIERLCGSPATKVKTETKSPSRPSTPPVFPRRYHPPLGFPPPLLLPHRTIPELLSLHFKPEPCSFSPEPCRMTPELEVKEEALSDDEDDEQIDVLTTSPLQDKHFDFSGFPGGKRRSFSVQFKLNVLDAFYNDKDCNKNQRATARKFNINRRQVQKWLTLEGELRGEGCHKPLGCAGCPQHCTVSLQPCTEQACLLSDLQDLPPELCGGWPHPSALAVPHGYHYMPWFSPYDIPRRIY